MRAWNLHYLVGVGGLLVTLVACGGDEFTTGESTTGTSGAAGNAGTAGSAGSTAGTNAGGSGGDAGSAGTGGSEAAGSGGGDAGSGGSDAGSGGSDAGSGGSDAGSGGSDAGAGGDAGAAGDAGAGGDSGAGGSVVDPCLDNTAPTAQISQIGLKSADAPSPIAADINDAEDGKEKLTYLWKLKDDQDKTYAPTLDSDTAQNPTATSNGCGTFVYEVTATDSCGKSAATEVTVVVTGNGPHVSNTLCPADAALRCGTVAQPWCEIDEALTSGARKLKVHGSGTPYKGDVELPDTTEIAGNYDEQFSQVIPGLPATFLHTTTSEGLSAAEKATISIRDVRVIQKASQSDSQAAVTLPGNVNATLQNVFIDTDDAIKAQGTGAGLKITAPKDGSVKGTLSVNSGSIRPPAAVITSEGVLFAANVQMTATLTSTTIEGGKAPFSYGILSEGAMELSASGCTVRGGLADVSMGIKASNASKLTLQETNAEGQATKDGSGIGLQASAVKELTVIKGTYTGSTSEEIPSGVTGIRIETALDNPPLSPFLLSETNARGGNKGTSRLGVSLASVVGKIEKSTIYGSKGQGGSFAVGISAEAYRGENDKDAPVPFPNGSLVIENNTYIAGGNPNSVKLTQALSPFAGYIAMGIFADSSVGAGFKSTIQNNAEIRGCDEVCKGRGDGSLGTDKHPSFASGMHLEGGTITVAGNTLITGGNWLPDDTNSNSFTSHSGIDSTPGFCIPQEDNPNLCFTTGPGAVVDLKNNAMIAGSGLFNSNGAPQKPPLNFRGPRHSAGILAVRSSVTAEGGRILGGVNETANQPLALNGKPATAIGVALQESNNTKLQKLRIAGGNASSGTSYGIYALLSPGVLLEKNWIESCGLESGSEINQTNCGSPTTFGLLLAQNDDMRVANNYIFGGYGFSATACALGRIGGEESNPNGGNFVHNLCLGQGNNFINESSTALAFLGLTPNKSPRGFYVANNLLAVLAGKQRYHIADMTDAPVSDLSLFNNGFLTLTSTETGAYGTVGVVDDPGIAYYLRKYDAAQKPLELDKMSDINTTPGAIGNDTYSVNNLFASGNPIKYVAPTPEDYFLSEAACKVVNKGANNTGVVDDFQGDPRPGVNSTSYEIGPDECK